MAAHETPEEPRTRDFRMHAEFHARESPTGVGAAVVSSDFREGHHVWDCIVTDGSEWHYIRVVGHGLGAYPNVSVEAVEEGIERFAATLPQQGRIRYLINSSPLQIEPDGAVHD